MSNFFSQFDPNIKDAGPVPAPAAPSQPAPAGGNFFAQFDSQIPQASNGSGLGLSPAGEKYVADKPGLVDALRGLFTHTGQAYDKRLSNAQDLTNRGLNSDASGVTPLKSAEIGMQLIGGPIADVGSAAVSAAAPYIQKVGSYLPGMNTYNSGVNTLSAPIEKASGFISGEYNKLPQDVKDVGDMLGTGLGAVSTLSPLKPAQAGMSSLGNTMVDSGESAAAANKLNFAKNLVSPLNDTKAARIDAVGNTDVQGILQKSVVQPTAQEAESAANVANIPEVKASNTIQANRNAINDAIGTEAESLKTNLNNSGVSYMKVSDPIASPIPKNVFHDVLNSAVNDISSDATLTGDAQAVAKKMADKMHGFVDANPATPAGLLTARQQFDQFLNNAKKNAFDPATQNAFTVAGKTVRDTANAFISESVPSAEVSSSLAKQSSLFRALENIDPKAAKESPTALGRLGQKIDNAMPVKNALVKGAGATLAATGLGTAGVLAPLPTAAAVGTGAALYGAGKLAMSPTTRIVFGKALRAISGGAPSLTSKITP